MKSRILTDITSLSLYKLSDLIESVGLFPSFSAIIYIPTLSLSIEKMSFFKKNLNKDNATVLSKISYHHAVYHMNEALISNRNEARNVPVPRTSP